MGVAQTAHAQEAVTLEVHIAALRSLEPADRVSAIQALGESRDPGAVAPLSETLRSDPSAVVRGWAARALAQIGTAEANAAVAVAAQRDADERVRSLAAQLSGQASAVTAPTAVMTPAPANAAGSPQAADVEAAGPSRTPPTPVQRTRRRGLGLIIAGWAAFGFSYMIAIMSGGIAFNSAHIDTWPMFVPLVGGIIELSFAYDYDSDLWYPPGLSIPAFIDAVIQMAGVALAAAGHVLRAKSRSSEGSQGRAPHSFALVPSGPGGPGLSLMANF